MAGSDEGGNTGRILQGTYLLCTGRREGVACFGDTKADLWAALAPSFAFNIVSLFLVCVSPAKINDLRDILLDLCGTLMMLVVSQFCAQYWQRGEMWLRYMVASLWCGWSVVIDAFILTQLGILVFPSLKTSSLFLMIMLLIFSGNFLWVQWYIARVALAVSGLRAAQLCAYIALAMLAVHVAGSFLPPYYSPPASDLTYAGFMQMLFPLYGVH